MNKKFSTLLAGVMLVSAFTVDAATTTTPANGKSYLLQTGTSTYLSANIDKTSGGYGQLLNGGLNTNSLADVVSGTWKVTSKTTAGSPVYTFTNKVTGTTLSVDPTTATKAGEIATANITLAGGSVSEWALQSGTLVSYFKTDSVYYLQANGRNVQLYKGKVSDATSNGLAITADDMAGQDIPLFAEDLNTLMRSVDSDDNFFALSMDPEVSKGKANHLTATGLHATDVAGGYVTLQAKDKKNAKGEDLYVVVDTAYYEGTETSGQLLKYTYDKFPADHRLNGSYNFKFTYNVKDDKLYVQVKEVADMLTADQIGVASDKFAEAVKVNNNNSKWSNQGYTVRTRSDKFIYMAKLDGTYVLTLNTTATEDGKGNISSTQNVTVTTSADYTNLTLTTMTDGVYLIQYKSTGGNKPKQNEAYAIANLAGDFGWVALARNQEFRHMPAAQWVVKKNGTSSIAPISITNREFNEQPVSILPATTQLFAVEGKTNEVFYFNGSVKDTVSFIKVDDALVKDTKLGYKYVSANESKVQTFTFNYLHGLALDKYLYTPAGKDSIVRVDENDARSNFRLELVAKDDKYGYEDGLVRNVYYVYTTKEGKKSYLSYDTTTKKYMMKSNPTPFFLKENNCIDGKHYYALVEANLYKNALNFGTSIWYPASEAGKKANEARTFGNLGYTATSEVLFYNENGSAIVLDNSEACDLYAYSLKDGVVTLQSIGATNTSSASTSYAIGVKVSVDDNTLDLTQGDIHDKLTEGLWREIRTSAFAVEIDDSPLYRRFNNEALGESATDGVDSLAFVESIRNEYLMDEWNKNLQDKDVDYVGIWNKDKAEGRLFFHIDTTWVNRGLGNIKPQYLISVARNDQPGTPGVPCTYEHNHYDNNGNLVDAAHCGHAIQGHAGFAYGKYLVNFSDSVAALDARKAKVNPYKFSTNSSSNSAYTRVGFVKAIHAGDSLFVLTNGFETMDPAKLDTATIIANYKKAKLEHFIVDLVGDKHKNVTWSFRYVNPDNAGSVAKEGVDNAFLFESNVYGNQKDAVDGQYTTVYGDADKAIAPTSAVAWLKMHNGCLVLTDRAAQFDAVKTAGDGALVFNVDRMTEDDKFVTSNDEIATDGVSVVAGNGTITVQGAAGKSVVITNILGKVVAETVLTSDNATIAVPAGIVAVAVDGEEAVKVVVK